VVLIWSSFPQANASVLCASAEGVWQPTMAGASLISSSFSIAGYHEQCEVHAARDVALENGVADVSAPDRQALALAFFQVASSHDRPLAVAGEDPPTRLHLIVQVCKASEFRNRAEDVHDHFEFPRVHVLPVACDVPPAREHEARLGPSKVEHCLSRP
jgi:hypothetical protein